MTTGAPIYLVSACASGEEFVSAFRRYADRNGVVFIPIAQPLPPGKKGRFALTLKDGGVMVEGEAEVVSSAKTPSVLYGRIGMTLKFTEPDAPSKTLLAELEKARLAMKPSPPSVAPRPADVPAEPRPTPPAPGGRIDAVNALAECVVIGDVSKLVGDDGPPKIPNPKFVVPSIPAMGPGARPKSPSGPVPVTPPAASRPITGGTPVVPSPLEKKPVTGGHPVAPSPTATTMGMPPLEKKPGTGGHPVVPATPTREDPTMPSPMRAAVAAAAAAPSTRDQNELLQTVRGPAPAVDLLAPPPRTGGTAPPPIPKNATPAGAMPVVPKQPTPPAGNPFAAPTTRVTPPGPVPVPVAQPAPFVRPQTPPGALPIAPPPPIIGTPPQVVHPPDDADEPTDLNTLPINPEPSGPTPIAPEKSGREGRKTVIGVAVVPSGVHVLPAAPARVTGVEEARDTSLMDAAAAEEMSGPAMITNKPTVDAPVASKVAAAAFSRATVEEPTPSGDWTMTVGESGPTIVPTPRAGGATKLPIEVPDPDEGAPIKTIPAGPPTGDWMIALDPSQPDGWSEPSRIEKRPEGLPPEQPGPPVSTVSSEKDLDSEAKVAPRVKADEAKVEIDPTLMEPLQPMQAIDDFDDEPQLPPPPSTSMPAVQPPAGPPSNVIPTPVPMQSPMQMHPQMHPQMTPVVPMQMDGAMHGSYTTPLPGQVQLANASAQVPVYGHHDVAPAYPQAEMPQHLATEAIRVADPDGAKKRRKVIIAASAGVLLLIIILAAALGGGGSGETKPDDTTPNGSADVVETPAKSPPAMTPAKTPPPPEKSGSGDGSAQQAIVRPAVPADAAVEDPPVKPDAAEQQVVAAPTECEVELSSVPQGAEIVLDKGVIGTTPTKLKLPCGVESKLTFRRARYQAAQRSVTPKSVGQKPVRVALAKVAFTVKVSSSPPGANIMLGARSLGITPAAIKLPAFETSTLKITKDGYAPDIQKVTPKTNNLSISSALKRNPTRKPR